MSRQPSKTQTAKYFGYYCTAIALPYLLVLGAVYVSMPDRDSQWREQLAQTQFPVSGDEERFDVYPGVRRTLFKGYGRLVGRASSDDLESRIQQELAAQESVGQFVSFDELLLFSKFFPNGIPDGGYGEYREQTVAQQDSSTFTVISPEECVRRDFLVAKVLLKWSDIIRAKAVTGQAAFGLLSQSAEEADSFVINLLQQHIRVYGSNSEVQALYDSLPSTSTVTASRQNALIYEWKNPGSISVSQAFLRYKNLPTKTWLFVERMKADRYRDKATKTLLDYWATGASYNRSIENSPVIRYLLQAKISPGFNEPFHSLTICDQNDRDYRTLTQAID